MFSIKFGSITKVVGWGVSLIGFTAGIKEFKEEVVIVGISVSLASKGLDFVIDSLNFAGRDFECGMGNDTLEMAVQKSAEPE